MILERTAKGQTVFAQLLYAPRLAAQSAHAAPTQSRYTCDGAVKWYLLLAQAIPRVSLMTGHLRTSITVEIVSPGPSRATIEARPERAADRAPAHGRTSLPPRGPVGCCRRGTRRPRRLIGKCRAGAAAGNVSAEGEAIRSNDYRKDTTVKAPSTRPAAVLGLDVGKSSHLSLIHI